MFFKYEWWEILGLLYASMDWIVSQNQALQDAREAKNIENKIKSGKMQTYFRSDGKHKNLFKG